MSCRWLAVSAFALALASWPARAGAYGIGGPISPADMTPPAHTDTEPPFIGAEPIVDQTGVIIGFGHGYINTDLDFDLGSTEERFRFEQQVMTLIFGVRFAESWTVRATVGLTIGGDLDFLANGRDFELGPGVIGMLTLGKQWRFGQGQNWFVSGYGSVGYGGHEAEEDLGLDDEGEKLEGPEIGFRAVDARVGVLFGRTFGRRFHPYVTARGFYNRAYWSVDDANTDASDRYHFGIGAGLAYDSPLGFVVNVDGSAIGERTISVSLGLEI